MQDTDLDALASLRDDLPAPAADYLFRTRLLLTGETSAVGRAPHRSRLRLPIALVGAAASTAAGLIALTVVGASPASAASVLAQAADAASAETNPSAHDGQYTYVAFATRAAAGSLPARRTTEQEWIPVDGKGTGLIRDSGGFEIHLTDGVMTSKNPYPDTSGSRAIPITGAPALPLLDHPSYDYLRSLPTDPAALLTVVYQQADAFAGNAGRNRDQEAFTLISEAMSHSFVPPKVRAAFYQALSRIPGVSVMSEAKDGSGRDGIAVARADGDEKVELVFDKNTHQLLGELALRISDGSVTSSSTLGATGIVDAIGDKP